MHFKLLLTLILTFFTSIKTYDYEFGTDLSRLRMCVEYHLSSDPNLKIGNSAEKISEIIAKRFRSKSFTEKKYNQAIENIYFYIKQKKSSEFSENKVPEQLKASIKNALKNCVERKYLPKFVFESESLADLLDLILVDWPTPLNEMINTREGRSTLRMYAYSTGVRLMSTLRYFSIDFDLFHRELRRFWMRRARQFYEGRDNDIPYIRHRFTTDRDRMYSSRILEDVHTIDDVNALSLRSSVNFMDRNSMINAWKNNQILLSEVGSSQRYDSFSESFSNNTSDSECYLEIRIVRCYRIILFVLEMQLRNINTDEDDIYNGTIPHNVVPLQIQEMAWSGVAYRNYLTAWQEHLQQFSSEQLEVSHSREDLIIFLSLLIIQNKKSIAPLKTTTTTTTTSTEFPSTTTTLSITSTEFSWYKDGSKRNSDRDRDCERYFLLKKRLKSMFSEQDQQQPKHMDSSLKRYGYIANIGELKQQNLPKENDSIFLKILGEYNFINERFCDKQQ